MADSRDILGKNRKFKGTSGVVMPKGSTAERVDTESGELRFNTTTELMEYYDGNQWKPIDAPPTISSISTDDATGDDAVLAADGSTLYTVTITGGNFGIGLTVKFIGNTGTEYVAGDVTRVSGSSITCTTTAEMGTADDPYDVQVINPSGLAALLEDAFSFNAPPVFTNASGTLGEVYDGQVISGTTLNAGATDAEGNEITFSIVSGTLPGSGLSISSSTGAITGTLSGTPSLGNYPFTVRAATAEGIVERAFSIDVVANPFMAATGGTVVTEGNYKIHTFTGPGSFVVSNAGNPSGSNTVDYLVVAGGGGAGGAGGGAGGFREAKSPMNASPHTASPLASPTGITVTATTFPITVGGGGTGANTNTTGGNGNPSVFSTITSTGGGGGHSRDGGSGTIQPGGSGGGAGQDRNSPGGSGNTPPVSPSQGNNGGFAPAGGWGSSGGGGGAGAVGGNGQQVTSNAVGGAGGAGVSTAIRVAGTPVAYAGGGGGGGNSAGSTPPSPGGSGGGGTGAGPDSGTGTPGSANTGGGGGGSEWCASSGGTTGGSGIVVIRYKFQ
jgi:hypothetical protein